MVKYVVIQALKICCSAKIKKGNNGFHLFCMFPKDRSVVCVHYIIFLPSVWTSV